MIKRWRVLVGKKKSNACLLVFLLQDLSCGIFVIYPFDNMLDNAIAIDHKSGAFGANVFLTIEVLFAPYAIGFHYLFVFIGQQSEGEIIFFPELLVRRSEEHTSELQSLMRISYAVFCLKKKKRQNTDT